MRYAPAVLSAIVLLIATATTALGKTWTAAERAAITAKIQERAPAWTASETDSLLLQAENAGEFSHMLMTNQGVIRIKVMGDTIFVDGRFLIDTYVVANANPAHFLAGRIDTETIGTIGHSLGGATVLLASYHATLKDPRIDATIALSPLACVFRDGFFDTANVPLMIEAGTVDMITEYTSNHLTPFGYVQAPKYLLTFDGGTHLGFNDRLLFGASENGDDAVGCSIFVGPSDPRPVTFEANLPPDFLGGPALGVDPSGSKCGPLCPLPPPSYMLHARQNALTKAASIAFFEAKLRGAVSGHRMITSRLATDNADATLSFSE